MKKSLPILLVFIIISNYCYCQEYIYEPVFIDQCSGKTFKSNNWWVSDSVSNYYPSKNDTFIKLKKSKKYKLHALYFVFEPRPIKFEDREIRRDTFQTHKLILHQFMTNPHSSEFSFCDKKAEGILSDFYYNGNLRISGNFKNGQPIDTLKQYYPSGVLREIFIPKEKKYIFYKPNGEILEKIN